MHSAPCPLQRPHGCLEVKAAGFRPALRPLALRRWVASSPWHRRLAAGATRCLHRRRRPRVHASRPCRPKRAAAVNPRGGAVRAVNLCHRHLPQSTGPRRRSRPLGAAHSSVAAGRWAASSPSGLSRLRLRLSLTSEWGPRSLVGLGFAEALGSSLPVRSWSVLRAHCEILAPALCLPFAPVRLVLQEG